MHREIPHVIYYFFTTVVLKDLEDLWTIVFRIGKTQLLSAFEGNINSRKIIPIDILSVCLLLH